MPAHQLGWHVRCYKNHSSMVTVSLQPFAFRKIILLVAAVIWLTSAVVFADPVFMNAHAREFGDRSTHSASAAASTLNTRDTKSNEVVLTMLQEPSGEL